jgi:hypothetical protein
MLLLARRPLWLTLGLEPSRAKGQPEEHGVGGPAAGRSIEE